MARPSRRRVAPARRRRRPPAPRGGNGGGQFGSTEITQSRVALAPSYGPALRIPRSLVYNWTSAVGAFGTYTDWSLSDVVNSSEYTNLFAQWRLEACAISITWRSDGTAQPPIFYIAVDPFASAAPTTVDEILQRPHRTWSPNAQRSVLQLKVPAKVIDLAASGPGSGALVCNTLAPAGSWFTTGAPSLAYGSLLAWIEGYNAAKTTITVKQDYMFSFRGVK